MSIKDELKRYENMDAESLVAMSREAYGAFLEFAARNNIASQLSAPAAIGLFLFFSGIDGSVDLKEYALFSLMTASDISMTDFCSIVRKQVTTDSGKVTLAAALVLMKEHPQVKEYLAGIALSAIAANREVSDDEAAMFEELFSK